jgi:BirA family transcriptional regulator, biotin operon repressor / biotin---[acetyl-CoA-carboxylase] ligase
MTFGRPRRHFRRTGSTNERARELVEAGATSGTVVTAAEQTAGRGRRGRSWAAPAGKALLYSAILRPLGARHGMLPVAAPLAVAEAVEAVAPEHCEVKWPNDVWIARRKVAGVLIEARPPEWAVIGVGLNVSIQEGELPADLRWPATSIGHGASVEQALKALNDRLGEWVEAPRDRVLAAYAERDALRGREVAWEGGPPGAQDGRGVAAGIDRLGNLVVELQSGRRIALGAGEVKLSAG